MLRDSDMNYIQILRRFTHETFLQLSSYLKHLKVWKHMLTSVYKQQPPQYHPFRFKPEKTLEAILYLTNQLPSNRRSRFFLNKYLYYADLRHLEEYSRYITGDFYVAMKEGPVPSYAYDMLKEIAGEDHGIGLDYTGCFKVSDKGVFFDPKRKANTDLLSPSEIACLDFVIENYSALSIEELSDRVHEEPAYKVTVDEKGLNGKMEVSRVVQYIDGGEALMNLLTGEQ